jgi:hypothetical protein
MTFGIFNTPLIILIPDLDSGANDRQAPEEQVEQLPGGSGSVSRPSASLRTQG